MSTRAGGRRPLVHRADIVEVGRELGMARLSVNAVATALGVSATALYRHVEGRWELEKLVGESILADLELHDEPDHDIPRHLLSFAGQLRAFVRAHPGLAAYLQVLFPRGDAGARLLASEVAALERRGYTTDAAIVLSGAVATLAIGSAAAEEREAAAAESAGYLDQRNAVISLLTKDFGPAHSTLPEVKPEDFYRLLLTAAIRGLVSVAPPGRPPAEIIADLGGEL
ncbi:TetR/AcrR family transcriptional regulator [Amycolatopsis sp. 195334CR]|uniref:TetR/AcrR family transcriptional regulator n=1 Tax=Amycolatopsis sp. 195334CR TaxID=2814588 RepID=UPI001A8F1D27|nr:TetR/AcrR family transcriptional regulator [Amycolatopsis sp. 195334CR]MBN6038142.1 TetR/AcrR family transcriptional regulator [Amycolatopsis sp. 195334CR]